MPAKDRQKKQYQDLVIQIIDGNDQRCAFARSNSFPFAPRNRKNLKSVRVPLSEFWFAFLANYCRIRHASLMVGRLNQAPSGFHLHGVFAFPSYEGEKAARDDVRIDKSDGRFAAEFTSASHRSIIWHIYDHGGLVS